MKKKNIWCRTDWATAQLYCEKKNLYFKAEIVLQGVAGLYCSLGENCIAIGSSVLQKKAGLENFVLQYTSLYCRLGGVVLQRRGLFVLQYKRIVL